MQVNTIKDYCKSKGFTQIAPSIRSNTNGYPFITFIDAANKAENIYFSKNAALAVGAGQPVTKDMLTVYQIGITENAAGEQRIKLISNSERINLASLWD
jgi:hypothetical protein